MKRFCLLGVTIVCALSDVFAAATESSPTPTPQFSTRQWLIRYKNPLSRHISYHISFGLAGLGGLVGAGFTIKKTVHVIREAIALKKQLQANPTDITLCKKSRALVGQAILWGVGGLVLGVLSGSAVVWNSTRLKKYPKLYMRHKNHFKRLSPKEKELYLRPWVQPIQIMVDGEIMFIKEPIRGLQQDQESFSLVDAIKRIPGTLKQLESGDALWLSKPGVTTGVRCLYTSEGDWELAYQDETSKRVKFSLTPSQWRTLGFQAPETTVSLRTGSVVEI
jgi:hypothetical protein